MNGISGRGNNLAFGADALPEFPVVKLATVRLAGRVVDVLHIDKNSNGFHSGTGSRISAGNAGQCLCSRRHRAPVHRIAETRVRSPAPGCR